MYSSWFIILEFDEALSEWHYYIRENKLSCFMQKIMRNELLNLFNCSVVINKL